MGFVMTETWGEQERELLVAPGDGPQWMPWGTREGEPQHEVRDALTAAVGYTQLLLDRTTAARERQVLQTIERTLRDAATMLEGAVHPAAVCDLRHVVNQATDLVPAARRGDLLIILEASAPVRGSWEEAQLRAVLAELLTMAATASATGTPIQVLLRQAGEGAQLVVQYQGQDCRLAHSNQLIEAAGGQLWTTYQPGVGSTVVIDVRR